MKQIKRLLVIALKQLDLGSAIAVRLTKLTGKSKIPVHPKHFLSQEPWFIQSEKTPVREMKRILSEEERTPAFRPGESIKYIDPKDVVLDLGSGNGQNAIKAAKFAKKVVACEIDRNLIDQAKTFAKLAKIDNVTWERADLEKKLKFKNKTFDKILFLDVLEHLRHRDQILSEVRRVLKPHGILFLGVPNSQSSWKKLQRSAGICSFSDPDHKIEFSKTSIKNLLKKHHFTIIKIGYGKYDTPLRGLSDVIGGFSISLYKKISYWREEKTRRNSQEASGFEIVARNR